MARSVAWRAAALALASATVAARVWHRAHRAAKANSGDINWPAWRKRHQAALMAASAAANSGYRGISISEKHRK
jgi:hypothetical protein